MSLKIENSRRKDESRPVCMDLKAGFPLAKFVARIFCLISSRLELIDRFHSRDRWPQWGGETIRNI
jgi:hypothetical protein